MNTLNNIYKYTGDLDVLYLKDSLSPLDESNIDNTLLFDIFHQIDFVGDVQLGIEKYINSFDNKAYYYDIVIVEMVCITEYKLIEKIHTINPHQIFIVITASSEIDILTNLINEGLSYLILKPFDENSLQNIIYKASKYIINERLALEHAKITEAYNAHLQEYNDTLNLKLQEQARDLEQTQATIINQSKFAIMGEMIAMIAHQWKQPLNVISLNIANLEMMHLTGKYSKKELTEIIENSNETIEYMSKTIHDFSEFLKPSDLREELKIGTIFYQLISLVKADIQKYNIEFNIHFNLDKNLTIELNSSKFTQVMINIIKNAIDEFKTKHIENPTISINIEREDNVFIIYIQDNAGGIPTELLETIFEPYVSTKGKNGTGLGMYMSKLLIVSHLGGTIMVSNKKGGALFVIKLPIAERRKKERVCV